MTKVTHENLIEYFNMITILSYKVETSVEKNDAVKCSKLQSRINEIKNEALIGLEYVIEVQMSSNFECVYHCVLCEGRFDITTVISHLIAYNHRLKYLVSLHFYFDSKVSPTVTPSSFFFFYLCQHSLPFLSIQIKKKFTL